MSLEAFIEAAQRRCEADRQLFLIVRKEDHGIAFLGRSWMP
jgi:hypothetical protein